MKTKTEIKELLRSVPMNEEDAKEYLELLKEYVESNNPKEEYEVECLTLLHLNILSIIAENIGYVDFFRAFGNDDYNTISYTQVKNYIDELIDYIKDILEEREQE